MFRFPTYGPLGGMLYPWWLWMMAMGRSHHRQRPTLSPAGNIKSGRFAPRALPPFRNEGCPAKYRGFPRMLRCLTINPAVAQPTMNGSRLVQFRLLCS